MIGWMVLAQVLLAVIGCGGSSGGQGRDGGEGREARGGGEREGKSRTRRGDELFEIDWHGGKRGAWVHVPEGATGKLPTILMFHGGEGANGPQAAKYWTAYRDAGFVLVFPNGQTEQPIAGWMPTHGDVHEHVDFTLQLLDAMAAKYPIDPDRVYAAGFSNGGQQVFRLACLAPERFRGFTVSSQTMEEDTLAACQPTVVRPMLWMIGTKDPRNPANGRDSVHEGQPGRIGIQETLEYWLDKNGCDASMRKSRALPDLPGDDTSVTETTYGSCKAAVKMLTIEGGGHSWPVQPSEGGSHCGDISGAEQAVTFWKQVAGL